MAHQNAPKNVGGSGLVAMVTGGSGFLGQHVVRVLQEKGEHLREIRVFDIVPYMRKMEHKEPIPVSSVVGDIRNFEDVSRALTGVDVVYHTAAIISWRMFPDYKGMEDVNVEGTDNVVKASIRNNVQRIIYTSSIEIMVRYGDMQGADESYQPAGRPSRGYADTKARAEAAVLRGNGTKTTNGSRLRTIALRLTTFYGEGDRLLVPNSIKWSRRNGGTMPRLGNKKSKMHFTYAGNVAWAHLVADRALDANPGVGGQFYIVTDDTPPMNMYDFLNLFLTRRGYKVSTYSLPDWLVDFVALLLMIFLYVMSPIYKGNSDFNADTVRHTRQTHTFRGDKAQRLLGYRPLYSYQESLEWSATYYDTCLQV